MTFDTPQWAFRSAHTIQNYGYVKGVVYIYPERGKNLWAPVVVPSEFFQYLTGVLPAKDIKDVHFYLEDLGGGRWIFGFEYDNEPIGLWIYTKSNMPPWFTTARTV
jgi:hypothetical protein